MKKLKVMVVVGTRPEIIRLSEVIKAIDKYFELIFMNSLPFVTVIIIASLLIIAYFLVFSHIFVEIILLMRKYH